MQSAHHFGVSSWNGVLHQGVSTNTLPVAARVISFTLLWPFRHAGTLTMEVYLNVSTVLHLDDERCRLHLAVIVFFLTTANKIVRVASQELS